MSGNDFRSTTQPQNDPRTYAVLAQIGGLLGSAALPIVGGIVVPAVIYLTYGRDDSETRRQAGAALNWQIYFAALLGLSMGGYFAAFAFDIIRNGGEDTGSLGFANACLVVAIVLVLVDIVLCILATLRASQGRPVWYPIPYRLVRS